jgi:hypothetical protein
MNWQNILKFFNSNVDLELNNSEVYDIELIDNEINYDTDLLDFNTKIDYDSLKIDQDLNGLDNVRTTISLCEIDNSENDPDYIYSGLTFIINYDDFINYFTRENYFYYDLILNNDIFKYETIDGEIHLFKICKYNDYIPNLPNNLTYLWVEE